MCEMQGQLFVGGSLESTGKAYSKFVTSWNGREETALGFGVDGVVRVLLPLEPNLLLVAGSFTKAYQPSSGGVLRSGGAAVWDVVLSQVCGLHTI